MNPGLILMYVFFPYFQLNDADDSDISMGATASHFVHSRETQSRHYDIKKRMRTSLKVSSRIKQLTKV